MRKKIVIVFAIIALLSIHFVGSGFNKNSSVYINEYYISEDGGKITINIGVASSAGYIRKAVVHQQSDGKYKRS